MAYEFVECAKRVGVVLIGGTEASVTAVSLAAHQLIAGAGNAAFDPIRHLYNKTLGEPVPGHLYETLRRLPKDGDQ